jgi:hypothetical protein
MNLETLRKQESAIITDADRRRHVRYRFSVPIKVFRGNGLEIPGMTLEISESGLSAALATPLRVGEMVNMEPVGGGRAIARVRHNVGRIHGFEFVEISREQSLKIKEQCVGLPHYQSNRLGI